MTLHYQLMTALLIFFEGQEKITVFEDFPFNNNNDLPCFLFEVLLNITIFQ